MLIQYTLVFISLSILCTSKNWYLIHCNIVPFRDCLIFNRNVFLIQCVSVPLITELECAMWLTFLKDHFTNWNWLVICLLYSLNQIDLNDIISINSVKMVFAFFFRLILGQVENFWIKVLFHIFQNLIYFLLIQKIINNQQITTRKRSYSLNDCMDESKREFGHKQNYFLKVLDQKVPCDPYIFLKIDRNVKRQFELKKKECCSKKQRFNPLKLVDSILEKMFEWY